MFRDFLPLFTGKSCKFAVKRTKIPQISCNMVGEGLMNTGVSTWYTSNSFLPSNMLKTSHDCIVQKFSCRLDLISDRNSIKSISFNGTVATFDFHEKKYTLDLSQPAQSNEAEAVCQSLGSQVSILHYEEEYQR